MTRKAGSSTRRRILTIAGSSALAGIAGCLGGSSGGGDDSMDGESTDEGTMSDSMGDGSMDSSSTDDDSMENDSMDDSTDDDSMDDDSMNGSDPMNPDGAPRASIDRFSEAAGALHVRGPDNDLPGPDEPIDFDEGFLTIGFGPGGETVRYYDFDAQSTDPAPIYALFHEDGEPVEDQLNVVDVVPGDEGYNDFWHVHAVTVPDDYEANAVTDVEGLMAADYEIEATGTIKNCPIVPDGSTASMRHDDDESPTELVEGWYDGEVVYYFLFEGDPLEEQSGDVPTSPIYVTFEVNPGEDGGGPPSGFATEAESDQSHDVVATVPGDAGYSPLWDVNIYDNAEFGDVSDLESALEADVLESSAARVNCPVVSVN
ncbi:hypothetical protein BRC93_00730 [Halobacteriales archaeon QS_5_70_15]|nr:MAG: hypothetical protein BRC93_00730 [Halobacteriales archaeon QS_5_70_15]